jgi:hypothetical protein
MNHGASSIFLILNPALLQTTFSTSMAKIGFIYGKEIIP